MKLSDQMRAKIAGLVAQRSALHDEQAAILAECEKRDNKALTADEQKSYDEKRDAKKALDTEISECETRLAELVDEEQRDAKAAESRAKYGTPELRAHVTDAPVYAKDNTETSFFRDLYNARKGDRDAHDRLIRSEQQRLESRALSTAAGAGGEFAPPAWLIEDYVKLARAGRKFADSLNPMTLPSGVSSVNIPKVSGGTSTAVQATQNSTLSQTDLTTTSVSSGITTIGGKQVVAQQLLDQSGIPFDQVISGDLAADHARSVDTQSINGSGGSGQLEGVYTYFVASGTVNTTYTQATPAVGGAGGFYAKIFGAAAAIEGARFVAPDTIWMHPRRWNWVLGSSDSNNRPLVVPGGPSFNVVGEQVASTAEGIVGQIGGLDVVTDANIVTNTGAGTNQDPVLVGVRSDLKLWESALHADSFDAPYADSMGVLFRIYSYAAQIPSRYTTSVSVINGTGLIAPTF